MIEKLFAVRPAFAFLLLVVMLFIGFAIYSAISR